jgi:nucleotide-binding universal stress UspA family protein
MEIKQILVPVDFSDTSDKAIELAAFMAAKFGSEITLYHVVVLFKVEDADLDEKMELYENLFHSLKEKAEEKSDSRIELVAKQKVPVHKVIVRGLAASDSILEYIDNHPVDLVIMGTHGKSGIQKVIQGSVTERIVRLSPVPVLTVHPETPTIDFDNILVPVDFSVYSEKALQYAVEIAKKYNSKLHCFHVVQKEIHPSFYSAGITSLFELDHQLEDRIINKMKEELKPFRNEGLQVQFGVAEGKPVKEILTYASNHEIDLIVMGTHGLTGMNHLLMGSVSEKVVRHANVPVIVVKKEL